MFPNFRHTMAWLHTWFGLALGLVLMVVFFFGSLSVFDREIDRWAIPDTRYEPQPMPSFDKMLAPIFKEMQPGFCGSSVVPMAFGCASPMKVSDSSDSRSTVGRGPSWASRRSASVPASKEAKRQPS